MNGLNGVLIIGVGLFLLYLGFTGKLDCVISVFKTCASGASDTVGGGAVGNVPAVGGVGGGGAVGGDVGLSGAKNKLRSILK